MDESVIRAMTRWPEVPAVFGWLELDHRCRWLLRGELVRHPRSIAFFNRNFASDAAGRWYVQNGPQRVFVDLAYLPLRFSFDQKGILRDQRGLRAEPLREALLDEDDQLILCGADGPGLPDEQALRVLGDRLCDGGGQPIDEGSLSGDVFLISISAAHKLRLNAIPAALAARHCGFQPKPRS